ncbi:hypothetical protein AVEN_51137-1 [Araneus ventricosus]|uniref:Uncharacterized protein n=1 Tax=Araneus ventricosus TaxID=182803 RepID=A0A4Y2TVY9_ARAVE|nr:hypothetical protein AVEN_51137-1 [Araneus ventricosus]
MSSTRLAVCCGLPSWYHASGGDSPAVQFFRPQSIGASLALVYSSRHGGPQRVSIQIFVPSVPWESVCSLNCGMRWSIKIKLDGWGWVYGLSTFRSQVGGQI